MEGVIVVIVIVVAVLVFIFSPLISLLVHFKSWSQSSPTHSGLWIF